MAPIDALAAAPLSVEQAAEQRVNPAMVSQFAGEFCALLVDVRMNNIGPDGLAKFNTLLSNFEQLMLEMRDASQDIRRLLRD